MQKRSGENRRRPRALLALLLGLAIPALVFMVVRFGMFSDAPRQKDEGTAPAARLAEDSSGIRKSIFDRHFQELAISFRLGSIYARPLELADPEAAAGRLAAILGLDRERLLSSLRGERSFVWLGKRVDRQKLEQVLEADIRGVYVIQRSYRFYPRHQLAAHVIGFVKDGQGLAGVESYYDGLLRGEGVYDPALVRAGLPASLVRGESGANLVLTLDADLEQAAEKMLRRLIGRSRASSGAALAMSLESGELLALASLPGYDPNRFWAYSRRERTNRALAETVSTAGVSRLFQAAAGPASPSLPPAAADARPVAASSPGWFRLAEGVYGSPELAGLPVVSVPRDEQARLAKRLGLCGPLAVDLPEAMFSRLAAGRNGQEEPGTGLVQVVGSESERSCERFSLDDPEAVNSALALLTAFSRLVNGGRPVTPHLLKAVWQDDRLWEAPLTLDWQEALPSGLSQTVLTRLAGLRPGQGRKGVYVESLVRLPAQRSGPDHNADGAGDRYQALLLAADNSIRPAVAVAMVLEQASVDLGQPSPLRPVAGQLLALAGRALRRPEVRPRPRQLQAQTAGLYRQWLALQRQPAFQPHPVSGQARLVMPDVRGLSLRKALQLLQQYGLRLRVVGSGQVQAQQPRPGSSLAGVEEGVLELGMDG